jgi:uncharacterized protein YbjQ (UPF0145 family)
VTLYTTIFVGVKFVEGRPASARIIKPIRVEIGGVLPSAQLKDLDDVKRLMVSEARKAGGNAVVEFKYGQRSVGFWRSLIDRDDVHWYGTGSIAVLH